MNRREFIKISALGFGGLALIEPIFGSLNDLAEPAKLNRYPTYCEICFWKCAGWVQHDNAGNLWKITGNDSDPHCNGRLCPRGTGGIGMYNDPDRLKTPLIRTGKRGEQTFREASWDEALGLVAKKMKEISKKYGPETMAMFSHGSGGKLLGMLMKAYGTDSLAAPSYAQCRGPREAGFVATFGESLDSPEPLDIRNTQCLVLIGSHLGENMHNGQVQEMSDAIDNGATIITVDPRFSTVAGKSKFWLPIKPATDMALLLTWIHEIIYNNWYDKEYVEQNSYGFEQLKEHVKDYTPEWAYGITTIDPDLIRKSAKAMADASPAVIIHPGRHVTWYGDDTQRSRAIAILNALLGSYGRRGGFFRAESAEMAEFPHPPFKAPRKKWKEILKGQYPLTDMPLANAIVDYSIPSKDRDFQYRGWIVNGSNLNLTMPDNKKTLEAIQNLELLVAIDTMPMEICGWADVVLPECTYLERYDVVRNDRHREPNFALRMPAAKPLYNSKPGWWITKKLASKLDLDEYFKWRDIEEFLDYKLKKSGTSLEEMKKLGVKKFERQVGSMYFEANEKPEFSTNTGKIELYSSAMEQAGFDPMPKYTAHEEPADGFYRLIYGRAPMHTFSRTANNAVLTDIMDENTLWINPKIAGVWGIKNNQYIWLKNQDNVISTFPIKARITERIRWDSVYMVHGFGHADKRLTRSYGKGASDAELITRVHVDPVMGGTGMRGNFVTFLTTDPKLG